MTTRFRLLLFTLITLFALYFGFFYFEPRDAVLTYKSVAYWSMALTLGLFIHQCYRAYWPARQRLWAYVCSHAGVAALIVTVVGTLFMYRAEPIGFKTVMDEHLMASTAKSLHESRTASVPRRMVQIQNADVTSHFFVDKRPVLQPFLVSVLHDLTGFRTYNSIYLNLLLSPLILLLLFVIGERMGGIFTGIMASLMFATLPLLSFMAAGGGMEPVNLLWIVLTWLLGTLALARPDAERVGAFALSGVILAQARYESVLFILPVGLMILYCWWKSRRVVLPWSVLICPFLLLPYVWLYHIFQHSEAMWQLADVDGATSAFGTQYIVDNLGRALGFFLDTTNGVPNSLLLSVVGILCVLLFSVKVLLRWREFNGLTPWVQAFSFMLIGFAALLLLLVSYAWHFDSPIIVRLSLPLHIPMAVAGAYCLFSLVKSRYAHRVFALIFGVYVAMYAFPVTSNREYSLRNLAAAEFELAEDFLEEYEGKPAMFIAENSTFFYIFDRHSLNIILANKRKQAIKNYLALPNSLPLLYMQRLVYNPATDEFEYSSKTWLDEEFVLEPYWEKQLNEVRKLRFMRVVDVEGYEVEEFEADNVDAFMQHWAKQIP